MSSQRCGAARSDFFYDICFYVVCGTACQTHFKVWTQLFAPSRDTHRAPCLLRTDKILLVRGLVSALLCPKKVGWSVLELFYRNMRLRDRALGRGRKAQKANDVPAQGLPAGD